MLHPRLLYKKNRPCWLSSSQSWGIANGAVLPDRRCFKQQHRKACITCNSTEQKTAAVYKPCLSKDVELCSSLGFALALFCSMELMIIFSSAAHFAKTIALASWVLLNLTGAWRSNENLAWRFSWSPSSISLAFLSFSEVAPSAALKGKDGDNAPNVRFIIFLNLVSIQADKGQISTVKRQQSCLFPKC